MRDLDTLKRMAETALRHAESRGADAAEVYLTQSQSHAMGARGDFVEPKEGNHEALGARIIVDGRLGHSGTSGLTERNIHAVVDNALESVTGGKGTGDATFAHPTNRAPQRTTPHAQLIDPDPDRLSDTLNLATEALRQDSDVTFHAVKVACAHRQFLVANSNGVVAWDESAGETLQVAVRVTRGSTERTATDAWAGATPVGEQLRVDDFCSAVAARARDALDVQPLARSVDQVVLVPQAAAQIVGLFTAALSARRIQRNQSPLAGRTGEPVAAAPFMLLDRPHGPDGSRRMAVDHEGTPTEPLDIIQSGILGDIPHDHQSATEAGTPSNGHGVRAGTSGAVLPRIINPVIEAGDRTLDEILEGLDRAVVVPEMMMGSIGANNTTGDFSLVAPFAFLYENGKRVHALPPTTVAGNAHRFVTDIRALSRERRSIAEGVYPTIHAAGVACAT